MKVGPRTPGPASANLQWKPREGIRQTVRRAPQTIFVSLLALPPAAAFCRASGLVLRHKADALKASPDVRF